MSGVSMTPESMDWAAKRTIVMVRQGPYEQIGKHASKGSVLRISLGVSDAPSGQVECGVVVRQIAISTDEGDSVS